MFGQGQGRGSPQRSRVTLRPEKADSRPERADFRPERADFRPERVDFRPERADFRPERSWENGQNDKGNNEQKDEQKSPCVLQDFVPFGAAAQKRTKELYDKKKFRKKDKNKKKRAESN